MWLRRGAPTPGLCNRVIDRAIRALRRRGHQRSGFCHGVACSKLSEHDNLLVFATLQRALPRYNVCKMLKDFARGEGSLRKRTVFATIHQPSEEVFNLFDKAGRLVVSDRLQLLAFAF